MKSTTFAIGALLASVAIAQPYRHPHRARHQKRNEDIVWVTDYEYVTETIGITTTIWVSEGFQPSTVAVEPATTSSSSSAASPTNSPNQFFENASKAQSSTSSVYVAPTPESTYVAPVPTTTSTTSTSAYVAPAPTSKTSTSVAPVVENTPSPVYTPVAQTTTSTTSPAATTSASSGGSSTGTCSSGSPCEGDITYYEAGLGACGTTNDGSVEKVVALPVGMMGSQSNGNPYCGKTVTIKCGDKTTTATVVDKCMGCTGNSIDLSNAAFEELAEFSVGRTTATWYFN